MTQPNLFLFAFVAEISFFDLQFMKPTNLKANNGKVSTQTFSSDFIF